MRKLIIILVLISVVLISAAGCGSNTIIDYEDVFMLNGINYSASSEQVITDDKTIGNELGTIKFTLTKSRASSTYQMKDGDATFLKAGTKIYYLKNVGKGEVVATKNQGNWILYKAMSSNNSDKSPSGNGITEDTFKASALIVKKTGNGKPVKIEDKEKIKKVLDGIKSGVQTKEDINYPEGNTYTFYFVVPDKNGIGQIVYRYYPGFQDNIIR